MNPTIHLQNVAKRYQKGRAFPSLRSLLGGVSSAPSNSVHWAVKDLNFALQPGEALGIIGPNGAGKTTILKLLSRVTYPTQGHISISGRLSALIELGAGFHPDLSGRENIYLNAAILGMKRAEVKDRFDQIVDFAGVEPFLDTPVKRYSSGMYARLGFAVAAHVDPEILLVDEVLAVGDMAFQKKCYDHMKHLIRSGVTMIFVSHNMRAIQEVCPRCLVMYRGEAVFQGNTADATAEYSNIIRSAAAERQPAGATEHGIAERVMTHAAIIEHAQILRADGRPALTFASNERVTVRLRVHFREAVESPVFACAIRSPEGQMVYNFTTSWAAMVTPDFAAGTTAEIDYDLVLNLAGGTYQLGVDLAYNDLSKYYDRIDRILDFVVVNASGARGLADLQAQFKVTAVQGSEAVSTANVQEVTL